MGDNTMKLKIFGEEVRVPADITYGELADRYREKVGEDILLVLENNSLRELSRRPREGAEVRFLTFRDPAGFKAYSRSLCLMMLKAFRQVMGDRRYRILIHFVVSDGLFCTLEGEPQLTDRLLCQVKDAMDDLRKWALPFGKTNMSTKDAIDLFREKDLDIKADLLKYRISSRTNVYNLGDYHDYYYGYMLKDTSYLTCYDLKLYKDGFVLCMPDRNSPGIIRPFQPMEKLFYVQRSSDHWGDKVGISNVSELNRTIVEGGPKQLILTQEAYHEKQIADIAEEIAGQPSKKLVMIAGPSSSGKTTFSHRLSTQLSVHGLTPHPVPVDDYFVNREDTPRDENGDYNYECLEAIDTKQFNEDMTRLLAGDRVEMPTYNFKTGMREYRGKYMQMGKNDILVIEGIHGLNDALSYSLPRENKFKIYISALTALNIDEHNRIPTTDGRLLRRMVRDARTRGTIAKNTLAMWHSVNRGEKHYIFPYQESADRMFNSSLVYELAVLKIYATPLLHSISRDDEVHPEAKRLLKFLDYFLPIPPDDIPKNSLVREFIGGSCFDV